MVDDTRPPFRQQFDHARDPYTARNALGITGGSGGGGDVSSVPTPTSGQYAKWTGATTIQGVAPATVLSDIAAQPLDADLTSLAAAAATNAIYYRSAANTWSTVTIGSNLSFASGTLDLTASPTATTPSPGDNDTSVATTAFVTAAVVAGGVGAWTAWTPTITAGSGTITSYTITRARYQQAGKTITAHFDFTITNAGTGAGTLLVSLPVTASASGGGNAFGREVVTLGVMIVGSITPSGTTVGMLRYEGSTVIGTNNRYIATAIYEGV